MANTPCCFSQKLKDLVGKELDVRLNNNRSTMLRVKWSRQKTFVSLHRMFAEAPIDVHQALASYIRREHKVLSPLVKSYIEENKSRFSHAHKIDTNSLIHQGVAVNLQAIYETLNGRYFNGSLALHVTWYNSQAQRYRSRCNLGLYYDSLKLIKVHRLLDHIDVPLYVVEYIVYHEMVHAVCPAYVDNKGINRIHSVEFKQIERQFMHYKQANEWLKINRRNFFLPQKDVSRWQDIVNGQILSIRKQKPTPKKAKSLRGYLKKLLMR